MVVLTGVKIAFSGNLQPWELVRVVIGLWVPWVMLQFYTTPIPGMAFTFPGMIAAGGNWLHALLIGDAAYSMQTELGKPDPVFCGEPGGPGSRGQSGGSDHRRDSCRDHGRCGNGDVPVRRFDARAAGGRHLRSSDLGSDRPGHAHHPGAHLHSVSGVRSAGVFCSGGGSGR